MHAASARLPPGAFAFVMATGIVALAADGIGVHRLGQGLGWVTLLGLGALGVGLLHRLVCHRRRAWADLSDHRVAAGYFTLPAGICVAGAVCAAGGASAWAGRLLVLGVLAWLGITYAFWAAMILRRGKPPLARAINGTWLVSVVATQAVVILAALVAPGRPSAGALAFAGVCVHLLGVALYAFIAPVLMYRLVFRDVTGPELVPDHWINMGAAAISALAGATLCGLDGLLPADIRPALLGGTLLFWAVATWWLPLLLVLGVWRHGIRRHPLRYEARYWSLVFPLGMYSVASARVSTVFEQPSLARLAMLVAPVAIAAWALTFTGLLRAGLRVVRGAS